MRSCTINLRILLVGDIQYPKGMSNSDFFFLATSQPTSAINVLMVFQLTPPKLTVIDKNSELDMPFGYCMSPTSNTFRCLVHDLIMTEGFCSHIELYFRLRKFLTNFKF